MNTSKQRPLSDWFNLLMVLVILRHLIRAVTQLSSLQALRVLQAGDTVITVANDYITIYNLVMSAIVVVLICFIMAARRWALMAFFAVQIFNAFIQGAVHNGADDEFALHFFVALAMCGVMRLLLCIRKDGRSGWQVIMGDRQRDEMQPAPAEDVTEAEEAPVAEEVSEEMPQAEVAPVDFGFLPFRKRDVANPERKSNAGRSNPQAYIVEPAADGRKAKKPRQWLLYLMPVALLGGGLILFAYLRSDAYRQARLEKQFEEARSRLETNPNNSDVLATMRGLADTHHHLPANLYLADHYYEDNSYRLAAHYYLQVDAAYENSGMQDTVMYNKLMHSLLNSINDQKKDTLRTYYTAIPQRMIKRGVCLAWAHNVLSRYYYECKDNIPMALYHADAAINAGSDYGWQMKGFLYLYHTKPLNYSRALYCFLKCIRSAPDQKWPYYYLGLMYKYGLGVPQFRVRAKEYFQKAIDRGSEDAKEEYALMLMEE